MAELWPVQTGTPAEVLPEGQYDAAVADLAYVTEMPDGTTPYGGAAIEWTFEVRDDAGETRRIRKLTSTSWVEGDRPSNLAKWCRRLGVDASGGLDPDALMGAVCRVYIVHDKKGFERVDDVLAPKARKA